MAHIITGPFLATAVLCESAARDKAGSLTLIQEEGLHWFEVLLGGEPITRIPLRVAYQS